ncbi:MAG: hypothetical protein ACE37K_14180 [Planctomycetota bacterium]
MAPTVRTAVQALLVLLPIAVLAALIACYGVDVPLNDQWALVGRVERACTEGLTWNDVVTPHHEHWMPVPMALMLALASWTDWNCRAELLVNGVLGLCAFAPIAWRVVAAQRERGEGTLLALPTAALITTAITQHQNWLWGLQVSSLLCVASALAGLHLISTERPSPLRLVAAILAAVVASGSQFQGNLVWPAGLLAILMAHGGVRGALRTLLVWSGCMLAVAANAYRLLQTDSDTGAFVEAPWDAARYVLVYLGAPLAGPSETWSLLCGAVGCVAAIALLPRTRAPRTRPFVLALLAFSIGAAAVTAIGRLGTSTEQARASRYLSYATPMWIAVTILLASARLPARIRTALLALIYLAIATCCVLSLEVIGRQSRARQAARDHFLAQRDAIPDDLAAFAPAFADPELLVLLQQVGGEPSRLYTERPDEIQRLLERHGLAFVDARHLGTMHKDHQLVRAGLVTLKRRGLSVFRGDPP